MPDWWLNVGSQAVAGSAVFDATGEATIPVSIAPVTAVGTFRVYQAIIDIPGAAPQAGGIQFKMTTAPVGMHVQP